MREWNDMLEAVARLAATRSMEEDTRYPVGKTAACRKDRLVSSCRRFEFYTSSFWGDQTGPNPTDRRKNGSKHHVITDAQGIPLVAQITAANRHDVTQILPLVDSIPKIQGKLGRPRHRPATVQGDRAYDSKYHRDELRSRNINPVLARRKTEHGSGLGIYRWVVERTISWLHQYRRLRVRYERRGDIHQAFVNLGCILICCKYLNGSFC